MSGRNLLDTNIVIALFAQDSAVVEHLDEAEEVFIPSIVLGELYFGARKSGRVKENLARIDEFAVSNVGWDVILKPHATMARSKTHSARKAALSQKMTFGSQLLLFSMT